MSKVKGLGMIMGLATKKALKAYDFCNNKIGIAYEATKEELKDAKVTLKNAKTEFAFGYRLGMSIDEDKKAIVDAGVVPKSTVKDTIDSTVKSPMIKVGVYTATAVCLVKDVVAKFRAWYKSKLTVVTEGTKEEHDKTVVDRIRNISSVLVHGVCAVVSTLAFGLSHWITLSIMSSMVFTMWTI